MFTRKLSGRRQVREAESGLGVRSEDNEYARSAADAPPARLRPRVVEHIENAIVEAGDHPIGRDLQRVLEKHQATVAANESREIRHIKALGRRIRESTAEEARRQGTARRTAARGMARGNADAARSDRVPGVERLSRNGDALPSGSRGAHAVAQERGQRLACQFADQAGAADPRDYSCPSRETVSNRM
jgi:hypothetical protein